jgi:sporulation protein YlmC with PRC-barrel domain
MENAMIRSILAAGTIAFAMATSISLAQQTPAPAPEAPSPDRPAAQKLDPSFVGLAVYSSDGHKLGEVAEVGMAGNTPVVRAEMGEFLGLGASSVIINAEAIERKGDRVEITMTADEVKDTISKQRQKQPQ